MNREATMNPMSEQVLQRENDQYMHSGGRSQENRSLGFRPAFMDRETSKVYPSRFANGMAAPVHMLDGLPAEVVVTRSASGRVVSVKASIVSGFVLDSEFYTREQAARKVSGDAHDEAGEGDEPHGSDCGNSRRAGKTLLVVSARGIELLNVPALLH